MGSIDLTVLDVGHGSSAILRDGDRAIVIDTGTGSALLEFLTQYGITTVETVLVSHADQDHIGGLTGLLAYEHVHVERVLVNSDPGKRTSTWQALRVAVADRRRNYGLQVETQLTTSSVVTLSSNVAQVQIVAPTPEITMAGPGGADLKGRVLSSNSMSAVALVNTGSFGEILLTGDLDHVGLDNLLEEHPCPRARVLVFPHHGGASGGNDYDFAKKLCDAVQPSLVIFSIGRGRYRNPRSKIIKGVRAAVPNAHIACTQLSAECAAVPPTQEPFHLSKRFARGREKHRCCAGTLHFKLGVQPAVYLPSRQGHLSFVNNCAPTALCTAVHTAP